MANVSSSNGLEKRLKLRFPGFDEPWVTKRFSDLFSFLPNNTLSRADLLEGSKGNVQNIHYGDVLIKYGSIIDVESDDIPSIAQGKESKGTPYLRDGDVIIADTAEDEAVGKCCEIINVNDAKVESGLHTIPCRPLASFVPMFLGYYMNSQYYHKQLFPLMQGVKVLSISKSNIGKTHFSAPSSHFEQKKIVEMLHLIDLRISKQQHIIEVLKKYKRGVFEMVFSQKVRLIPQSKRKDWQKYKLSDFTTRVTRKNGGQSDIPLTISAQYGLIDQRDFFSKTIASTDMSGYYLLRSGEYAYNRSTSNDYPFGSIKRLELYPMGAVSTLYLCFRVKDDIVLSDLAKWYFESSQWHRGVNEICAEGARNHGLLNVPTDGFFNTVHTLPSDPEEQLAIASYLSLFQARLDSAQAVLEKLLHIRSGLMQRLFI